MPPQWCCCAPPRSSARRTPAVTPSHTRGGGAGGAGGGARSARGGPSHPRCGIADKEASGGAPKVMANGLSRELQYEHDVQLALQMSLEDQAVQQPGDLHLATSTQREVWKDQRWRGVIRQFGTLNQFHGTFAPVIEETRGPRSICGAFVMAYSVVAPRLLDAVVRRHRQRVGGAHVAGASTGVKHLELTSSELHDLLLSERGGLCDAAVVLPEVERAMRWLRGARTAYILKHPQEFASPAAKRLYLSAWVANYEISDYLAGVARAQARAEDPTTLEMHFLRNNQWPEYAIATHEERARIGREEKRFGGRREPSTDRVVFQKGDVKHWVDTHVAAGSAHTRYVAGVCNGEWAAYKKGVRSTLKCPAAPTGFVVDLNGHFVYCLALLLDGVPTLLTFNTTRHSYLAMKVLDVVFECAFGG